MTANLKSIIESNWYFSNQVFTVMISLEISTQSVKSFYLVKNKTKWWISGKRSVSRHMLILTIFFILTHITILCTLQINPVCTKEIIFTIKIFISWVPNKYIYNKCCCSPLYKYCIFFFQLSKYFQFFCYFFSGILAINIFNV